MDNKRKTDIEQMRIVMGTAPSSRPKKITRFIRGCEAVKVDLIGYPENPYKQLFEAATATWGDDNYNDKWVGVSPENRYLVVKAALSGQTLPQALESFTFQFKVRGISRSAFDQIARARIGATFFSSGVRDNNKLDASFIMPTQLYDNEEIRNEIVNYVEKGKNLYEMILKTSHGSWQAARSILWMGMHHPFECSFTYLALLSQCSRRLKFCEQEDTVGAFWAMRQAILEKYPLLGLYLRSGCDKSKKCQYHQAYSLSEMFGCLFAPCGRHKSPDYDAYEFNWACTDRATLEEQLGFKIPGPNDDLPYDLEFNDLSESDLELFYAN